MLPKSLATVLPFTSWRPLWTPQDVVGDHRHSLTQLIFFATSQMCLLCLGLRRPEATAWSSKCLDQFSFLQTMYMAFVHWVDLNQNSVHGHCMRDSGV